MVSSASTFNETNFFIFVQRTGEKDKEMQLHQVLGLTKKLL